MPGWILKQPCVTWSKEELTTLVMDRLIRNALKWPTTRAVLGSSLTNAAQKNNMWCVSTSWN